ncbi:Cof-type HAD-IIB family hydrolase [Clostridium sp. DL1XJH146]
MKFKLVAVDMDGTLINTKGTISEKNVASIKKAVEKGIIFTICTGRAIQGVELYDSQLGLDLPYITYNGAMIVMGKSKEILYEQGLLQEDAREILKLGRKFNTTMIVWADNKLYVNKLNERVNDYEKLSNVKPILIQNEEEIIQKGITKIIWYDDVEKMDNYQSFLRDELGGKVNFCTSKPFFLEFFHKEVSKGIAVKKLGEHLGIKKEEMIAIGDGFNDLSMIEYVGMGVAMANAPKEVKAVADYITMTNDEDGVAHILDKFIKQ